MTDTLESHTLARDGWVKVWDPAVRIFHWSLVGTFAIAYLTADDAATVHEWAGYAALALVSFRLLWGFIGTEYARFSNFFPAPSNLLDYLRDVLRRKEARYLGHNPGAAVMIIFLLLAVGVIGISGWLLTTDWGWGSETLESIHEIAVNITLIAIAIHVSAAVYESFHHRENLIRSMFTGWKRR